jgi:hypothetical protein
MIRKVVFSLGDNEMETSFQGIKKARLRRDGLMDAYCAE